MLLLMTGPRRTDFLAASFAPTLRDSSDDDARPAPPSQRCVRRVQAGGEGQGPAEFVPAPRLKLVDEELKQLKRQRNENANEANLDWSVCTPPCLLMFPCMSPARPHHTHAHLHAPHPRTIRQPLCIVSNTTTTDLFLYPHFFPVLSFFTRTLCIIYYLTYLPTLFAVGRFETETLVLARNFCVHSCQATVEIVEQRSSSSSPSDMQTRWHEIGGGAGAGTYVSGAGFRRARLALQCKPVNIGRQRSETIVAVGYDWVEFLRTRNLQRGSETNVL
jgi:hypothetical protein